jgi:hypothetical protein
MLRGKILIRLISNLAARSMGKGGLFFQKKNPAAILYAARAFLKEDGGQPLAARRDGGRV